MPNALAGVYASDEVIVDAVHLDVTDVGLESLGSVVPLLAPTDLPVDAIGDEGGWWCFNYVYDVSGLIVDIAFDDVQITPNTGYLDADLVINVAVNSESDPFSLYTELACIPSDCDGWVEPFEVNAHTTIALDVIPLEDGTPGLDVIIGDFEVEYELSSDATYLEDCPLGTTIEVLDWFGLDVVSLILDALSSTLDETVSDLAPELESTIESAFSAAVIAQDLDLQGKTVSLAIQPGDIEIKPDGMRISMDGFTDVDRTDICIADWDDGTFEAVESASPPIGQTSDGVTPNHAANVFLSDNFGNQLLYSVWKTGLLCYTVDDELGFPIDTSILGLLAGDAFKELFPDAKPMTIVTQPKKPPTLAYAGENDVNILVDDLGLDFMAELDYRKARVLSMDLKVNAGVDLEFDGTTGSLGVNIDLGSDAINGTVGSNDFAPDSTSNIEESFGSVFNGLVGGLIGDMVGDISFNIPGFSGIGITEMSIAPAGDEKDWLGGYIWLGEVEYASTGCSDDGSGGCSDAEGGGCTDAEGGGCTDATGSGCEGGGCASAPRNQRRWIWGSFLFVLAVLRRRE